MTQDVRWSLQGDYFENCNCDFVCPCEMAPTGPLTQAPTQGYCDVMLAVHIDSGSYGDVSLDGLNSVIVGHAPGPMGAGNWSLGLYLDAQATDAQRDALQAILSGGVGGPMADFAPLVGTVIGVKSAPITYTKDGRRRSVAIPNVMNMGVAGIPSMNPDSEIWASIGHPFNPERMALAVGVERSTYTDSEYGFQWDNSGKNGHYAEIRWSNG
jgi:hypothetical protein